MQKPERTLVILGTGGTIAGTARDAGSTTAYTAGQIGVDRLLAGVPGLDALAAEVALQARQVAQIDSKDMDIATWQALAGEAAACLARDEVAGIVVTHGTDTLEETAWLLHRVLAPRKPLVLTAAMRPASAASADGPGNLLDALRVASNPDARGVGVVLAGALWHPQGLRKLHTMRTDAFVGNDAGPIARLDGGVLRRYRDFAFGDALGITRIARPAADWPRVEIVTNHAAADGRIVDLLVADGVAGIVVAATGHGTVAAPLQAALGRARDAGVEVRLASRCGLGPVLPDAGPGACGDLAPPQARVELLLELLGRTAVGRFRPPSA